MNRTNETRNVASPTAAACHADAADKDAELRAKRVVNIVATLRVLVPVALITALVMSGRPQEVRIENAMAAASEIPSATIAASQSYYPAQFVNQGVGGEEHVPNF